jgi:RNA polymerase sigma-70 factor, ECF subfamily
MNMLPETRESLLIRLANADDALAWDEFVAIYRPMILRLGLRMGLQASDSEDMTQRVLMAVSRAIGAWKKDSTRGGFRAWLRAITRNAIINTFQRSPISVAVGGSQFLELCHGVQSPSTQLELWIEDEHERSVLRLALSRVQSKVSASTWRAFEMKAMLDCPVQVAADELELSVGKIYGAKGRVLKMLQQEVAKLLKEN